MRRLLILPLLLALIAVPAAAAAKKPQQRHWAAAEIKAVVDRGLLAPDVTQFRPDEPVTGAELAEALAELLPTNSLSPSSEQAPLTLAQLDARLVNALGLKDSAYRFLRAARAAGLKPPSRFGTEVVARLLGLRVNHPQGQDERELLPNDPATRAEAAYSLARILRLDSSALEQVRTAAREFALPTLSEDQRSILSTATSLIGMPYVWGGTSDKTQSLWGKQVPGGYDCSGFTWRVYKTHAAGAALRGRTSMAMSGEAPAAKRFAFDALQPADVVFFGTKGAKSKPAQVDHMGIYVGNGWLIHSSGHGVALTTMTGWYAERFAWARRPLAELPA